MTYSKTKIGKVDFLKPRKTSTEYSDKSEDILLEIYSNPDSSKKIEDILSSNPPWYMYYHLSPRRGNLVNFYNFRKDSKVLEVGSGCGAITEALAKKEIHITSLELTEKRARINANRNKNRPNLEVVVENLENYSPTEKFDYVVCVGVLEYAGKFTKSKDPYANFVKLLRKNLKPNGVLLLAIENRLGLKYWSGATEDHLHKYFAGQNDYPLKKGVKTFGKKELEVLLLNNGFSSTYFYFPFPDYKTPDFVYSEDFYPGNNTAFPLGSLPTVSLDYHREHFFSEQSAMRVIEANNLFPDFANSFLVEAKT